MNFFLKNSFFVDLKKLFALYLNILRFQSQKNFPVFCSEMLKYFKHEQKFDGNIHRN